MVGQMLNSIYSGCICSKPSASVWFSENASLSGCSHSVRGTLLRDKVLVVTDSRLASHSGRESKFILASWCRHKDIAQ